MTLGEYTRAPDRVLSSAQYSTRERTGKHSLALRSNTVRRVLCYAGQAQAQLFLIRALRMAALFCVCARRLGLASMGMPPRVRSTRYSRIFAERS